MSALFKLSYGLFVLTAKKGDKDTGCIINTAMQVTDSPTQISICVNNSNYTCELIKETKEYNISILSQNASFDLFKRFGFQSGRNVDKFEGFDAVERAENGINYITEGVNGVLSVKVTKMIDLGTHTMFIGDLVGEKVLDDTPSATYQYYFDHIKPAPENQEKKKGFVCTICGYVYEGDELPPDFICPICKHGAEVFKPL